MHDVDDHPTAQHDHPVCWSTANDSPLFFANAEDFLRRALAAVDDQTDEVHWFVLNTEANVEVDITALDAVDELRRELARRGIVFALARVKQDLLDDPVRRTASWTRSGTEHISRHCRQAVAAYRDRNPDQ
ncbi:STAS domain-containing protein [Streptomyces scabiei]|uniref:STAS domain-containing protein n=1 Tax=Streptomyces scabiei TaxID=1930 RepID=UPI002FEEDF31